MLRRSDLDVAQKEYKRHRSHRTPHERQRVMALHTCVTVRVRLHGICTCVCVCACVWVGVSVCVCVYVCRVYKVSSLTLCEHQQGNLTNDRMWDEQLKIRIEPSRFKPAWYPAKPTITTDKRPLRTRQKRLTMRGP